MMRNETVSPLFRRTDLMNLNGAWQLEIDGDPVGEIEVPMLPSAPLSGVANKISESAVYRRTFRLEGLSRAIFLRFGGVGGHAEIFFNGNSIGTHGGTASFLANVTPFARVGENEITVRIQKRPQDEFAGIFRTVQLEFAGRKFLSALNCAPDAARQYVFLYGAVNKKAVLRIRISFDGKQTGEFHYPVGEAFSLAVPIFNPVPWRLLDGNLYTLCIDVLDGAEVCDRVYTYIGFQMGKASRFAALADPILYPRSLHTAADVCLLKQDLTEAVKSKANALFVPRYPDPYTVHYCDRVGMGLIVQFPDAKSPQDMHEHRESAMELAQHPCIQAWAVSRPGSFWQEISVQTGIPLVTPENFAFPADHLTDVTYFAAGGVVCNLYAESGISAYTFPRDPSPLHEEAVRLLWTARKPK